MKFTSFVFVCVCAALTYSGCRVPTDPACESGQTSCGGSCVSTSNDPAHCGSCERACAGDERCVLGACQPACVISGAVHDAGTIDPLNACAQCAPASSGTQWSARPDGTSCALHQVCAGGACASQCFINGVLHEALAVNPDNTCEQCDPGASTTAWSARADGTTCATNEVCGAGVCRARCFIDGAFIAANELNPADPCQQCNPARSTTAWSTRADGASCAGGKVCQGGACTSRCFVGGAFFAPDASNPGNACERCDPTQSTSAFSLSPNGTPCAIGQVCSAGDCGPRCFIGGVVSAENDLNPLNPCEQCTPSSTTTAWSARATGTSCGAARVCEGDTCVSKCFIGGALYPADAVNPAQACEQCQPATSTTGWTMRASVPLLVGGIDFATQGWSAQTQAPASVTYGTDYTRLVTSTNTGAISGGLQLLYKPGVVDAGVPFSILAEVQVESVSPHNSFDSAAAFLGAFTPPFGAGPQRGQMLYLDSAAIGWADDTQSAPLAVTNGLYRTYLFSVDAANTARVSVDGVPLLTRTGFVSNGTIAIGDQTNDVNVDAVMRIRSISRVCP